MVLRKYMFDNLYTNPIVKGEETKAEEIIILLYKYFMDNPEQLPLEFKEMIEHSESLSDVVCDYIAGMTDNYAVEVFQGIYIPKSWINL